MSRRKLSGRPYRKNDPRLYAALRSRQPDAIRNAQRLVAQYHTSDPARDNPSTTVHQLVEELNKFSRESLFTALQTGPK